GRGAPRPYGRWRRSAAVEPALDEVLHDGGVGQRRGVAEGLRLVLGDLAEDPPHDLARARLRQLRGELEEVRRRDGAEVVADVADELGLQLVARLALGHER